MPKEKLTLSVDKEAVDKAKKLGINISAITEKVLTGFTFSAKDSDASAVHKSYKELFDLMKPLLQKYSARVPVAAEYGGEEKEGLIHYDIGLEGMILLEPDGTFYSDLGEVGFRDIERIDLNQFLPVNQILSYFIDALIKGSERHKEVLKELEMAKRIIKALPEEPTSREVKKRRAKRPPR